MRTNAVALCAACWLCACSSEEQPGDKHEPAGSPARVAMRVVDGRTTLAFADSSYQARLQEIIDGSRPMDFHWVAVTLPSTIDLHAGASLDLAQPLPLVSFTQVYGGVCNPAAEDFSFCWLFESYGAGDQGLTGQMRLQLDATSVTGMWDVTWEGTTDRFQGQPQWHRHGTNGAIVAKLDGGTSP